MTENYIFREVSEGTTTTGGKFSGSITVEYSGLSYGQKQNLEKHIMKVINGAARLSSEDGTSDAVVSRILATGAPKKKIFTKWQTNYLNTMPPGMVREEATRIFRKRFKGATPSDTQIFNEYCRMKGMEGEDATDSPDPSSPTPSTPLPAPKEVIPNFSVGDSVRYAKGNPAHPAKIGRVVEADKGIRMLVEFGPTDRKYVFRSDYEKVENNGS